VVQRAELDALLDRAKPALSEEDHETLKEMLETLAFLTQQIEAKNTSIGRLRRMLFGPSSEKTNQVLGAAAAGGGKAEGAASGDGANGDAAPPAAANQKDPQKEKHKGHGRNGAAAYTGATKVTVPHGTLKREDLCPACAKGKVYPVAQPAVLVRVQGMAPLQATVYELERLRCNLCGDGFTATAPPGVGDEKYDETVSAMIATLRYGAGTPLNRIEQLQKGFGIPLPAATQWDLLAHAAEPVTPAFEELVRQGANGSVVHNDDTGVKVLGLAARRADDAAAQEGAGADAGEPARERTGTFTSGIVSVGEGHRIALFFTGRKHAGENLADVLRHRAGELGPPIQMCDALSRNSPGEFDTILAHCIAHARRRFVDVVENFPDECRHVLEALRDVYKNDAEARRREMSPEERLRFHQSESCPILENLRAWMNAQLDEHKVEPNSGLGEAIGYMQKHWEKLTLFLREPGAPLDNNICERALKKAILHRKNSLFYKTANGARVGDMFMSLIHTAELCGANPFDYLVELQRHAEEVAERPAGWMPWNYRQTLEALQPRPSPTP